MEIKWIQDTDIKREIAAHILSLLPEWFGISESTAEYIRESAYMPVYRPGGSKHAIGFLSIKRNQPCRCLKSTPWASTRLITVVAADGCSWRPANNGAGRRNFLTCRSRQLDGSHPDPHYRHTRCFYAAMGFQPLECLSALWGEQSPCLLMVQYLDV